MQRALTRALFTVAASWGAEGYGGGWGSGVTYYETSHLGSLAPERRAAAYVAVGGVGNRRGAPTRYHRPWQEWGSVVEYGTGTTRGGMDASGNGAIHTNPRKTRFFGYESTVKWSG